MGAMCNGVPLRKTPAVRGCEAGEKGRLESGEIDPLESGFAILPSPRTAS